MQDRLVWIVTYRTSSVTSFACFGLSAFRFCRSSLTSGDKIRLSNVLGLKLKYLLRESPHGIAHIYKE